MSDWFEMIFRKKWSTFTKHNLIKQRPKSICYSNLIRTIEGSMKWKWEPTTIDINALHLGEIGSTLDYVLGLQELWDTHLQPPVCDGLAIKTKMEKEEVCRQA